MLTVTLMFCNDVGRIVHAARVRARRLRPEHRNHVWSYDFVEGLRDERSLRLPTVLDKHSRRSLSPRMTRG